MAAAIAGTAPFAQVTRASALLPTRLHCFFAQSVQLQGRNMYVLDRAARFFDEFCYCLLARS